MGPEAETAAAKAGIEAWLGSSNKLALTFSVAIFISAVLDATADDLEINREAYSQRLHGFWLGQSIANWTGLVTEMDRVEAPFYTDDEWGQLDEPAAERWSDTGRLAHSYLQQ